MIRSESSREVVLDTHAALWWSADPSRLSSAASSAIADASAISISAISMWEIAMLVAKGRIGLDRPVAVWMRTIGDQPRVRVAAMSGDIAVRAAEFADLHGDPADRIIAATAVETRARLVTKDARLLAWAAARTDVTAIW